MGARPTRTGNCWRKNSSSSTPTSWRKRTHTRETTTAPPWRRPAATFLNSPAPRASTPTCFPKREKATSLSISIASFAGLGQSSCGSVHSAGSFQQGRLDLHEGRYGPRGSLCERRALGTGRLRLTRFRPGQAHSGHQGLYYADFMQAWRTYTKSATVARYASLKDAAEKLTQHPAINRRCSNCSRWLPPTRTWTIQRLRRLSAGSNRGPSRQYR